ncbi:hypothetical protein BGX29_002291 [Mortierella sp. GBA35]|nr:hypothetical protein BGX29_002291 [Mortierella sp. GBA35]
MLVSSKPGPASINNLSWSFVSARETNITSPTDFFPMVCHVDPVTGIFTMMSNFTQPYDTYESGLPLTAQPTVTSAPSSRPTPSINPLRPSGGYQYDPRTDLWSSFDVRSGYGWGDVHASFALFVWPKTTTLYHIYVADDGVSAGLGMLDSSTNEFVRVATWELDVKVYGSPMHFAYGDGVIYQLGSNAFNNVLGAPPVYNPSGTLFLTHFKDGDIRDSTIESGRNANTTNSGEGAVVIGAEGPDSNPWGFLFKDTFRDLPAGVNVSSFDYYGGFGRVHQLDREMTVSFGTDDVSRPSGLPSPDNKSLASSTIGWIVGGIGLFVGLILFLCIWFVRPRYRARQKEKKKREQRSESSPSSVTDGSDRKDDKDGFGEHGNDNDYTGDKFEATSEYSFDLNGRDKILVTPNTDVADGDAPLGLKATKAAAIDARTGYLQDLALETHPRPHIVTTMQEKGDTAPRIDHHATMTLGRDPKSVPSVVDLLYPRLIFEDRLTEWHVDEAAVQNPTGFLIGKEEVEDDEAEGVPAYSRSSDTIDGPTPSFVTTVEPSAPTLPLEEWREP